MHFIVSRKIVPKLIFGKFFGVFQIFSRSLSRNFTEISKLDHKSRWLWQNLISRVRRKPGRKVFLEKTVSQLFSEFEEQKVAISRRKSLGPALTVLKTIFQVFRKISFRKTDFLRKSAMWFWNSSFFRWVDDKLPTGLLQLHIKCPVAQFKETIVFRF